MINEQALTIATHTIWHKTFTWSLIYGFTVSGRTIKLKSVNWMESTKYHHNTEYETGFP